MIDVIVVYDRTKARVLEQFVYEGESDIAFAKRLERELAYRTQGDVEVVLLNARSMDDLKVSHARYFDPTSKSLDAKAFSDEIARRLAS
jgi:hypothetical protein